MSDEARLKELLDSTLAQSARWQHDRDELAKSHGELAVELGAALLKAKRLESKLADAEAELTAYRRWQR